MLQGIPENVNMNEIKKRILSIPGIINVHDLHAWTMDGRYNVMTIHIVLEQAISMEETDKLKKEVRHQLEHLNVQHLTVETELEDDTCILKDC